MGPIIPRRCAAIKAASTVNACQARADTNNEKVELLRIAAAICPSDSGREPPKLPNPKPGERRPQKKPMRSNCPKMKSVAAGMNTDGPTTSCRKHHRWSMPGPSPPFRAVRSWPARHSRVPSTRARIERTGRTQKGPGELPSQNGIDPSPSQSIVASRSPNRAAG